MQAGPRISISMDNDLNKENGFNGTDAWFPMDATIHSLFEEQVEKTPEAIAVYFDQAKPLTYRQLNEKANRLAGVLREKGVEPDNIVGVLLERSKEMMIGIMGILKAGGAYLPISPNDPPERINYVLRESQAKILLVHHKTQGLVQFEGEVIDLEQRSLYTGSKDNLSCASRPGDLAYVIFTSGSTGKPKGVMIEHRSVVNRLHWMQKQYPIDGRDTLLQKTPYNFDVSVWELFWWSFYGAKVCFLQPGGEKFPFVLMDFVQKYQVTILHFVPSMLNVFLEYLMEKGEEEINKLSSLRVVFVSGEALNPEHVRKFHQVLGKTIPVRLVNLYGPTEATVDVTYYNCPEGQVEKVPIGKPIDNIKLFVVSKENQLQPVYQPGELCISGVGLARGYLNNPAMTGEKFIDNPFLPGHKMYRTGDMARWLPDGNIEYLGREDFQVKIRGLRIELGEIEQVVLQCPGVTDCIVSVKNVSESIILIRCHFVSKDDLSPNEIKAFLKKKLPDYMVPNQYIKVDRIPLTPNGKADRRALSGLFS